MSPLHFLAVFVLICLLIAFTSKIKNPVLRWIAILSPPLCLIPLMFIPIDMFTIIFWELGFLLSLISTTSILARVAHLRKMGKEDTEARSEQKIRLVRPVLTVAIFCLAILCVKASVKSADNYAIEMGKRIQAICNAQKICPERVEGWQDADRRAWYSSVTSYGKYGAKFRIAYSIADDKQSFTISVRHNIDEGFRVSGGVNQTFTLSLWGPRSG